jgi:hypothetical protein
MTPDRSARAIVSPSQNVAMWYDAAVVCALIAACVVPRFLLRAEQHHWAVWLPSALVVAVIVGALTTRNWGLAGIFAVVLPIEVWRASGLWRRVRAASGFPSGRR